MPTTVRRTWQVCRSFFNHLVLPRALRRRTPSRAARAQEALEDKIVKKFAWRVEIPEYLEKFEL